MDSSTQVSGPEQTAAAKTRKRKTALFTSIFLVILFVAAVSTSYWYFTAKGKKSNGPRRPPATVTVAQAEQQTWQRERTGIGTVRAIQGTDLTSELAGKVIEILFESGKRVRRGELLVQLDASSEKAELESIEAELKQAHSNLGRVKELLQKDATTEENYEQMMTEVERLKSSADRQRAIIEKKEILAPFSGEIGIRQISLGQYLSPETAVATLQQLDPIYVDFDLPEQDAGLIKEGQSVRISVSAHPKHVFRGSVIAVNPLIEESTRSFKVRAQLGNEERKLRPGMFAQVVVEISGDREVVVIPQTAVAFNAYGKSVYFVQEQVAQQEASAADRPIKNNLNQGDSSGKNRSKQKASLIARRAFIQTGERRGKLIEIRKGIEPGTRVITSGQLKIDDGIPVQIARTDAARDVEAKATSP
ncbi:MAG: efflux transporter periplasmic adaptor subunit [Gimesia sp.]|uniref:Efflux transporter periplasmic adaptor subunit n=1 Tax=Gimesia maris TaxID=122 RepID=A0A3D3RCA1_9PLAN|nr:efflux transporter periplasmic adaptor subunit [Gimesia sp.]HCO26494.1 efflux transporter periplasmic adaptor subunit [Gimesia maris]|tara:strand:- start:39776 stop:41032 length:1257 start_codon:yes stop_codon:yes gene_type:complete